MLFLSALVFVVELLPRGYGESRMHRNGFGFTGHRTGTPNVVPVSSAVNCDEFASPLLSDASQTDRCGGLSKLGLAQSAAKAPIACLLSHPLLFVCWVLPEEWGHNNPGKSIHGFTFPTLINTLS